MMTAPKYYDVATPEEITLGLLKAASPALWECAVKDMSTIKFFLKRGMSPEQIATDIYRIGSFGPAQES